MKIVTRESSPSDSETIKATSTVISLPVFDSNGQIKAMYILQTTFLVSGRFLFLSPILLFFPANFPVTPDFFPVFPRNVPCNGENLQTDPSILYLCKQKSCTRLHYLCIVEKNECDE